MSDVDSCSACGDKRKCGFQEPESNKKAHSAVLNTFLGSPLVFERDPKLDCNCDGGLDFMVVKKRSYYEGRYDFSVLFEGGNFSVDGKRAFYNDKRQLKYLHLPENVLKLHLDLNVGYENVVKRNSATNEKLFFMLAWVSANKHEMLGIDPSAEPATLLKSLAVDFLCYRGLLTKVLVTPYEMREDWIICATKFKGTIYLCSFDTESNIKRKASMSDREQLMSSWGYKFEQYLTKSDPKGSPEPPETPVNENEEYCCLFKSKLNNNILLYGAEIDGVNANVLNKASIINSTKYIELKTSRIITTESQDINFCKFKVLKWWAQSRLASVQRIFCGFRDDYGIVQYVRPFTLQGLHAMGEDLWSPAVCFNFANCFLTYVKNVAVKDDPNVVYKFRWKPRSNITYEELHTSSFPEYKILPEWYTSQFEA